MENVGHTPDVQLKNSHTILIILFLSFRLLKGNWRIKILSDNNYHLCVNFSLIKINFQLNFGFIGLLTTSNRYLCNTRLGGFVYKWYLKSSSVYFIIFPILLKCDKQNQLRINVMKQFPIANSLLLSYKDNIWVL